MSEVAKGNGPQTNMKAMGEEPPLGEEDGEEQQQQEEEEEEYADAVTRHAKYLGIDPEIDAEFMWIAEEALDADVPEGWVTGEGEGEYAGLVYYYNEATGESTWDHPLDEYYREKFKRKKARKAEKKRRGREKKHASESRTSSSPSRVGRSTSSRRHTIEIDTEERDDRGEARRKRSSTRSRTHGSHHGDDRGGYDSNTSQHRSSASSRHKRRHKQDRSQKHDDENDNSERPRTSSRHRHEGQSRERNSSTMGRHRRNSDRSRSYGGDGEAYGDEGEHGRRQRKGSRRGGDSRRRDKEESRGKHRSRSHDDTQGGGSRSISKGERSLSRRATHDSGGGTDNGLSVSSDRRTALSSKRKSSHAKPKGKDKEEKGESEGHSFEAEGNEARRRERHRSEESTRESPLSEHEGINSFSTRSGSDLQVRQRRHQGKKSATKDGFIRTSSRGDRDQDMGRREVDRRQHRGSSSITSSPERPEETRLETANAVEVPEEAAVLESTWRIKSISREKQRSPRQKNSPTVRHRTVDENGDGSVKAAGTEAKTGNKFHDDEGQDDGDRMVPITVEPAGNVVERVTPRQESPSASLGKSDSAVSERNDNEKTRTLHSTGRSSDGSRALKVSTVEWNNNDIEEMDFEDEVWGMEDDGDGGKDLSVQNTSTSAVASGRKADSGLPSEGSKDGGSGEKRIAAKSRSPSPSLKAAATRVDNSKPGCDRQEPRGGTPRLHGDPEGSARRASKTGTVEDMLYRQSHTTGEDERHGTEPNSRGVVTSVMDTEGADPDDWPEVADAPANRKGNDLSDNWGNSDNQVRGRDRSGGRKAEREGHRNRRDESGDRVATDGRDRDRDLHHGRSVQRDHRDEIQGRSWIDAGYGDQERKTRMKNGPLGIRFSNDRYRNQSTGADLAVDGSGYGHGNLGHRWQEGGSPVVAGGSDVRRERGDRDLQAMRDDRDHWKVIAMEQQQKHQQYSHQQQQQRQQQQEEAVTRMRDLETKVVKLETTLASSTSREDHLREELADAARREGASKEKHITELAKETKKAADLGEELSRAVSKASEAAAAHAAETEEVERLRLELKGVRNRLKDVESALARKEEEENVAPAPETDASKLKDVLASKEAEIENQGTTMLELNSRLTEATNQASESARELHSAKDLAERLRLEAAENNSRAATSEAALTQAASEMSALSQELSRTREELSAKESEAAKTVEERSRLRLQLNLEQQKRTDAEDRLLRTKASFESEAESLRARAAEFQSANASMEREMRNGLQDAQKRIRELERERDAAAYEAKRSAELAASAETWRLKETLRADAAEAKALATGTEVAELRSEAARLRTNTDEVVEPYVKRKAELERELEETRTEVAALIAEGKQIERKHASEMASLKDEVSRKLPWIAEKAVAEAGKQWRTRAEEEIGALKRESDRRLGDLQACVTEGEVKRNNEVAGAKAETERFRIVAEKLAAENRTMRGELGQYHAKEAIPPSTDYGSRGLSNTGDSSSGHAVHSSPKPIVAGGDDNDTSGSRREHDTGGQWGGVLQTQVLEQVEAHINVLRAQLKCDTHGASALTENGSPRPEGKESISFSPADDTQSRRYSEVTAELAATDNARCVGDSPITTNGGDTAVRDASRFSDVRGTYRLSPTPAERTGNEGGLTEEEDMRLNRLLRSSKSATPSTPPMSVERSGGQRRATINRGGGVLTGSSDETATTMIDHHPGDNYYTPGCVFAGGIGDVSRELFGTSPRDTVDRGGTGLAKCTDAFVPTRRVRSIVEDEEDDLDDISDGGFHSGCWRRKYFRGEMR